MPASIGDASLAGLPPEAGLYACLKNGIPNNAIAT
jgi:MFS superfamily sulfate permease-like transporter